ncbi:MAG: TadE/TadG family type IV pilus assembly protein [Candidatus Gastranaerophilales bacterium]|nr:TadE/TadG family type IV pilus assembly protein [Candidatus Gastranaerophilales bacterium]
MKNYKKAQQIVEFALVVPVIIVIFMFIIEIGFILNARIAITEAVRISLTKVNQLTDKTEDEIKSTLENSIVNYVSSYNLPNSDSIFVNIIEPSAGNSQQTAIIKVNYKYQPVFNLLNFSEQSIFPHEFDFCSYQVVNEALFNSNNTTSFLTSDELSNSFTTDSSILTDENIDGIDFRAQIAFLIGFSGGTTDYDYARLFNWWGEDLLPPNLALSIQSGHLIVKSPYYPTTPEGEWLDTGIPYTWVLTSLGISHSIYTSNTYSTLDFNKLTFSLFIDGISPAFGSYDSINSISGNSDLETIKNYTFLSTNYVLKLFIPCTTRKPDDTTVYNFQFNLTNGVYAGVTLPNTTIVDCYIDSDGDGIPDAWDDNPEYPDSDGDGVSDGQQLSVGLLKTASTTPSLPDETSTGITTLSNIFIATPFKIDGSLNSHSSNSFTPPPFLVELGTYTDGSLYFKKDSTTYIRKLSFLNSLIDKSNFINGTCDSLTAGICDASATTINLDNSRELNALNNIFSSTNKVVH